MNVLPVVPNTPEWMAARALCSTASEAPAALGKSKYMTRSALMKQKSTGLTDDVDSAKQTLFDRGHDAEANARCIAEDIIGSDLYPATATLTVDGIDLLASLDGATMDDEIIWEHKLYSKSLADDILANTLDPHYTIQLDQQLVVSGAKRCLFMTSDGTLENMAYCWYESSQEKFNALIAGWHQFHADLAAYVPPEVVAEAVGRTPETLPALHIVMRGEISESNLADFKQVALTAIRSVNRDLKTDQDFADSAKARKWCEDIETRVAAAKDHALGQTKTIDDLFRTMDEISAEARDVRLALEKLEKARKESRKGEIVAEGIKALNDHIKALNTRFAGDSNRNFMPGSTTDFGGSIKGLRTFDSMKNAVDTALANAKISASATADKIQANLTTLRELAKDFAFLFADTAQIVLKAPDDLTALVKMRISEHQAAEEKKADDLRESIRKEEQDKLAREAEAKADAEKKDQDAITAAQATPVPAPVAAQAVQPSAAIEQHPKVVEAVAKFDNDVRVMLHGNLPVTQAQFDKTYPVKADPVSPPTLKLGTISERLGFNLTAVFLSTLGFEPAATDKNSKLFHESDFPLICDALMKHIKEVCQVAS